MTNTEVLIDLKKDLKSLTSHLEMISTGSMLERCNTIFQIGAYTLCTDKNGCAGMEITVNPTQYESKVSKKIANCFKNINGEILTPVAYSPKEWYAKQIVEVTQSIELFEKLVTVMP